MELREGEAANAQMQQERNGAKRSAFYMGIGKASQWDMPGHR